MTAELGVIVLWLALICAVYAWIASLVSVRRNNPRLAESARNATQAIWPLVTLAAFLLIALLVRGDFNVAYVWSVSERAMPLFLKITALWGSQAGSLLFWTWLMSTFALGVMLRNWRREQTLMPHVVAVMAGTLAFFLLLTALWENPFARYWQTPDNQITTALFGPSAFLYAITERITWLGEHAPGLLGVVLSGLEPLSVPAGSFLPNPPDGQGLNPLLRHIGMVIHPPMLYLGFVGFTVPYAFGMAALARNEVSDSLFRATRRWTLVAWLFLSLGLILGGRWAYDVLGWGGYWGWDPVENAALMPWLTGTAFLHSVMIQEKRGMLRRWNMVLITLTYLQVILGTFLTRSGVLSSVHSFAQSAIGPLFFLFVAVALIISVSLLVKGWDNLAADRRLESLLSRETLFLLQNFVFVSINVAVAIGTFWPLVTELLSGVMPGVERSSVGPPYYNAVTAPMFVLLLILMAVVPLVAWGRSSLKRFGRAMLWPLGFTAVAIAALIVLGVRNAGALIGYGMALLATAVTVLEFHRGAMARVQTQHESYPAALWTLFGRNRRRYGGYTIHLGVFIMAIGVISSNVFQRETQRSVAAGQTITLGEYVLEYRGLERFMATDGRMVTRVQAGLYRNGREVAQLSPRIDNYANGERMTIPATYTTLTGDDVYVLLVAWEQLDLSSATIKIYYNPLVNWVWGGGVIFIIGSLIAAWPDFSEERQSVMASREARPAPAGGD